MQIMAKTFDDEMNINMLASTIKLNVCQILSTEILKVLERPTHHHPKVGKLCRIRCNFGPFRSRHYFLYQKSTKKISELYNVSNVNVTSHMMIWWRVKIGLKSAQISGWKMTVEVLDIPQCALCSVCRIETKTKKSFVTFPEECLLLVNPNVA